MSNQITCSNAAKDSSVVALSPCTTILVKVLLFRLNFSGLWANETYGFAFGKIWACKRVWGQLSFFRLAVSIWNLNVEFTWRGAFVQFWDFDAFLDINALNRRDVGYLIVSVYWQTSVFYFNLNWQKFFILVNYGLDGFDFIDCGVV